VVGGTAGQVLAKIDSTNYNTQWVTPSGGGVTSVAGTGAISSSGGTAPVISIANAGTATVGAVQLTNSTSSTSTTTAATPNSVKSAYDLANLAVMLAGWEVYTFGNSGVIASAPRFVLTTNQTNTSGVVVHTRLVPHKDFTVSNLTFVSFSTPSSGLTLCRFGIYTRSGTTFTLVARTASDTTLFNTANTKYTRALDTAGGYPATYSMTAGSEYFISFIAVGTTMPTTLAASSRTNTAANVATGGQTYTQTGQTDLPASSTGTLATTRAEYAEVS